MRALLSTVALFLLFIVSGCSIARTPVTNTVDLSKFDYSNAANFKESQACATYFLGIGPFGNPSVMEAIKDGGIKAVKAVDYRSAWYIIISKDCVIVYGE